MDEVVRRTAPATPGLLNMAIHGMAMYGMSGYGDTWYGKIRSEHSGSGGVLARLAGSMDRVGDNWDPMDYWYYNHNSITVLT